jgi:glyoxylase-like metal-dependent hydrolase (beta-lactamase superfamily II)
MNNITILKIKADESGSAGWIYPVVLTDAHDMILVDCGYPGNLPLFESAFQENGRHIKELTKVILTHHDFDHMGTLHALKQKYPHVELISSHIEAPYISGEKKALRLTQAETLQDTLPEDQKAYGQAFCDMLQKVEAVPVDTMIKGGDEFGWCGGCQILDTAGHTPGHISLYLKLHETMITGDAAVLEKGRLCVANPQFADDLPAAEKSLAILTGYPADTFVCYHGGIYKKQ